MEISSLKYIRRYRNNNLGGAERKLLDPYLGKWVYWKDGIQLCNLPFLGIMSIIIMIKHVDCSNGSGGSGGHTTRSGMTCIDECCCLDVEHLHDLSQFTFS